MTISVNKLHQETNKTSTQKKPHTHTQKSNNIIYTERKREIDREGKGGVSHKRDHTAADR